jgi:hypothetical protein
MDARRAMRVLVNFATVSGSFLTQLEEIKSLMEQGLIKLPDNVRGERDSRTIAASHLVEISYVIAKLRGDVWVPGKLAV